MKNFGAESNHLQETKSSIYTSVQQFFFFLKMFQQLCCGFDLQDLETPFIQGDFNTLADRVELLGYAQSWTLLFFGYRMSNFLATWL